MKIIFLDIDGVLNCQEAYENGFCQYVEYETPNGPQHHQAFYPSSKKLINKLIKKTGAKVVITSTWRRDGLQRMREIWAQEKMEGEVLDITPRFFLDGYGSLPRGCEIKKWLELKGFRHIFWSKKKQRKYMKESDIENYIIIDDDSDMLYSQKNHFLHIKPPPRNYLGFYEKHYELALDMLSKDVIEMNYGSD